MTDETQEQASKVGKGKPPKEHQFKAGRSGNPRGRPKGAKGTKTILNQALSERVTIKKDGRPKTMSMREAIVRIHVAQAAKGDLRALNALYALMHDLGAHDVGEEIARAASDEELAMLSRFVDREVERRAEGAS